MIRCWFLSEIAGHFSRLRGGLVPMGCGDNVHAKAKANMAAMKADKDRRMKKVEDACI